MLGECNYLLYKKYRVPQMFPMIIYTFDQRKVVSCALQAGVTQTAQSQTYYSYMYLHQSSNSIITGIIAA
jgi:hypothetical protein